MYLDCKQRAFTLIELVIIIAIISIITTIALPNFHNFREKQEVSQLHALIRQHVQLAKNTAKVYQTRVVICSTSNMTQCENDQWNIGILVFSDLNNNKSVDATERVHQITQTNFKYGSLTWDGGATSPNMVTFQGDTGLPRGSPGSYRYCSFKTNHNHRRIPISPMGHTRIENISTCE